MINPQLTCFYPLFCSGKVQRCGFHTLPIQISAEGSRVCNSFCGSTMNSPQILTLPVLSTGLGQQNQTIGTASPEQDFSFLCGGVNLTLKSFTISVLNSYVCEKESFLFLCLLVTFPFRPLSVFPKTMEVGRWRSSLIAAVIGRPSHVQKRCFCCLVVDLLLIFRNAGYHFACTLFVMHTQVVEWVLAN